MSRKIITEIIFFVYFLLFVTGNAFAALESSLIKGVNGDSTIKSRADEHKEKNKHKEYDMYRKHDKHEHDGHDKFSKHNRHHKHENNNNLSPTLGLFMVDKSGAVPKENQTFTTQETPFSFIQFAVDDLNTEKPLDISWKWQFENEPFFAYERVRITDFTGEFVNLRSAPYNRDIQNRTGEWSVKVKWENPGMGGGKQTVNFFVSSQTAIAPEPVSSLLFLTGGAVLAGRRLRKKISNT